MTTREEAIEYLEEEGKIWGKTVYSKEEEKKIEEVMNNGIPEVEPKRGKIFGDPLVEMY